MTNEECLRTRLRGLAVRATHGSCPTFREYAEAWCDGRIAAGQFHDYVTGEPATPQDFLQDCLHESIAMARTRDEGAYRLARAREHVAGAIFYLENESLTMASWLTDLAEEALRKGGL